MSIEFSCSCGRRLQVADELAGKDVRCPECFKVVPAVAAAPEPPMAALAPDKPADPPPAAAKVPRRMPLHRQSPVPAPRTSMLSVAGIVIIAASVFVYNLIDSLAVLVFGTITGIVVSLIAAVRIRASGGRLKGSEIATTGTAIGMSLLVPSLLGIVLTLLLGLVFLGLILYFFAFLVEVLPHGGH